MSHQHKKKALLIGSTYGGLKGPIRDVKDMTAALSRLGFHIDSLTKGQATRDGIVNAWKGLNASLRSGDTAVIYYSGHGGVVESKVKENKDGDWRYQFIVPYDFKEGSAGFKGITHKEIAMLLKGTTDKTKNVTTIMDCCYSGRMARDPSHEDNAVPRGIKNVRYDNITAHLKQFESDLQFKSAASYEENPHAVRIAASSPKESAWEYENADGQWGGILTESLLAVINETQKKGFTLPWRNTLMRVMERVHIKFPTQHPSVEGPGNRHYFSLAESTVDEFQVTKNHEGFFIQAGHLSGVKDGSVFSIKHSGHRIAKATVTSSEAFRARATYKLNDPKATLPKSGLTATILEDKFPKWPVHIDEKIPGLKAMVQKARYIRPAIEKESVLASFLAKDYKYILMTNFKTVACKVPAGSSAKQIATLVKGAEQLGRAQHMLTLYPRPNRNMNEVLRHKLKVDVRTVDEKQKFKKDGKDVLKASHPIRIHLDNKGLERVYAWVFTISALGKITLPRTRIIDMPVGRGDVVGKPNKGLKVSWPDNVPSAGHLPEHIFIIVTNNEHVDLTHLTNDIDVPASGRTNISSSLERLTWTLAGGSRDIGGEDDEETTCFATIHLPYKLQPSVQ